MKKLLIAGLFSLLSISAYAGTSFSLSLPLVIGTPVYTQSVPVYRPQVRPPMCWNDYYGQWERCYNTPAPMPVYEYSNPPIVTFGYRNDNYRDHQYFDRYDRGNHFNHHDRGNHNYRR